VGVATISGSVKITQSDIEVTVFTCNYRPNAQCSIRVQQWKNVHMATQGRIIEQVEF